jgi:predicted transcriptional regulator
MKLIEMRKISKKQARKEILNYLKKHKEAYASDISEELGLDLDLVFSIMKDLDREGIVK